MSDRIEEAVLAAAESIYNVECGIENRSVAPLFKNLSHILRMIPILKADHAVRAAAPILTRDLRAENERLTAENELLKNAVLSANDDRDASAAQLATAQNEIKSAFVYGYVKAIRAGIFGKEGFTLFPSERESAEAEAATCWQELSQLPEAVRPSFFAALEGE